jgi:hypothetical protein
MTKKKESLLSGLFNFGKGKLSPSDRTGIEQLINWIDTPPSQLSDNAIRNMEGEAHQLYRSAKRTVANPQIVEGLGQARDFLSSAADMVSKNPQKRPPEVSENLRRAEDALSLVLALDDFD